QQHCEIAARIAWTKRQECRQKSLRNKSTQSIDRVQVETLIPRHMTAMKEIQTRRRARSERRIVAQIALELHLQRRIALQHFGRDHLGNIRLEMFLLLEAAVEETPRSQRVRCLRFEQRHQQACTRLADR